MTHYTCDVCGGKASGNKFKLPYFPWRSDGMAYNGDSRAHAEEVDVCVKCARELAVFIANKGKVPISYSDYDMESDSL